MLKPRTLKFLAIMVGTYLLLMLSGIVWPAYFDSFSSYLLLAQYLSVSLFHMLGVPRLLEHNGLCGWGWCSPTVFGWVFATAFWLLVAWGGAWVIAALTMRFNRNMR